MELTLAVDVRGARHLFGVVVDALKDLRPVLKEFDSFKRGKIAELFASEGNGKWPARSERSENRGWQRAIAVSERAPHTLLRKLIREHGRALSRSKSSVRSNAVARRAFVLKKFEELASSSRGDLAASVATFESADVRLQKSVRGLEARLDRAYGRANARGRLLGAVPQTIRSTITAGLLTIDSAWESPAVLALHDGAKVNNGAEVPPRPFLEWEESDVEYLAILFKSRAMLAWRS